MTSSRHLIYLGVCFTLLCSQLVAQTVDLGSRSFWIGEHPRTMDVDSPFVALRDIDWIEAVLGTDPILNNAVVQIEQEGATPNHSVAESIARIHPGDIVLAPDRIPPKFFLPDYHIYGRPIATQNSYTYVPSDPSAGFMVACGVRDTVEHLIGCTIFATYAPDDRIRLKARLYFPPDPADAPTLFRDVVKRLREVAYCLDVTEKLVDVPTVYPDLKGCRLEEVS
jgi:hypothetical protein